eukprot:93476-Chlamydomonas_euryale.AAC.2
MGGHMGRKGAKDRRAKHTAQAERERERDGGQGMLGRRDWAGECKAGRTKGHQKAIQSRYRWGNLGGGGRGAKPRRDGINRSQAEPGSIGAKEGRDLSKPSRGGIDRSQGAGRATWTPPWRRRHAASTERGPWWQCDEARALTWQLRANRASVVEVVRVGWMAQPCFNGWGCMG